MCGTSAADSTGVVWSLTHFQLPPMKGRRDDLLDMVVEAEAGEHELVTED